MDYPITIIRWRLAVPLQGLHLLDKITQFWAVFALLGKQRQNGKDFRVEIL